MDVFNLDRYKMKVTTGDRERIARQTEEFLKNGGKITKIETSISSSVNGLSEKQRNELRKKSLNPGRGGAKKC